MTHGQPTQTKGPHGFLCTPFTCNLSIQVYSLSVQSSSLLPLRTHTLFSKIPDHFIQVVLGRGTWQLNEGHLIVNLNSKQKKIFIALRPIISAQGFPPLE